MSAAEDSSSVVRITLREVYNVVLQTHDDVSEIKGAVNTQGDTVKDHEGRLRSVEKRVWAIPSLATVFAVTSLLISLRGVIH